MADDIIVAISLLLEYTETSKELNKKQFMALHATVDPVFESAKSSIDQWKVYAETATPTELAEQVKIEAAQERVLIAKMKPIAEGLIEKLIDSIPLPPPASEVSSTQTAIFPVPPTSSVFLRGSAAASQEGVQKSGGSGNYWVLYASVDAEGEYSTVVVGDPYKANLFFLSRTPTITDTEFEKMKEAAKANHYFINIVGLIKTEQSPEVCKHAPELKDKVIFE
uniref:Lipocalin/cytosolic fatty-acid binding domain-containing protein n=1 Tax=Chromera velia CCMP2878 TaxID=1169474 RepID=A0A0K6S7L2_9ALVE|eukprot:Cvel_20637.t1-p1 / transcript=Cvel_20637.t1 / gene=Cvel_20637 / organism=Chromera_velia_CCMP2878 / gene_product=hypothetical protein / transcript_product=hypothetical protein / location=Cvel_scaffold1871:4577-5242(-) / protein_length=222 / sequence_SO=supercontig / SO=protein_coding / is_pseudo=false